MFMASMRSAARDGELDGMGMFGATLKRDVAEYERRLADVKAAPPSINTCPPVPETAGEP